MPLASVGMIASLLWPGALSRPAKTSFHIQLGDLSTWLLAVFALGALIAAGLAYRAQRRALADQRTATGELAKQATALAELAEKQGAANALQARVVEQQLGVLVRQQADLVGLKHSTYQGTPTGLKADTYHSADVTNGSGRPVRNVVCRLQRQQNGGLQPAANVGIPVVFPIPEETGDWPWEVFDLWHHDDKIRLVRMQEIWVFVFPVVAESQAILTLRFTDDAGLHWQVDDDLHLQQLAERDW